METEFYKSIPPEIREKLQEYSKLYSSSTIPFKERKSLLSLFVWDNTPEEHNFWENHHDNDTFPIWSTELNRFISPLTPTNIDLNENPNKFYPL